MKTQPKDPALVIGDKELIAFFESHWAEMSDRELSDESQKYVNEVLEARKEHSILIKELGISREKLERKTAFMRLCMKASNDRTHS